MRAFRKYHRQIAIAACFPLILTVLSGVGYTLVEEWFGQGELGEFLLKIHTFEFMGLEKIYPLLNGLGLVGLLVTGLTMTSLFKKRSQPKSVDEE